MAYKHNDTCLQKAADDEPIFVLRAQDLSAPDVVDYWIARNPQISPEKRNEAVALACAMREWKNRKVAD